jgi:hypothetical protein
LCSTGNEWSSGGLHLAEAQDIEYRRRCLNFVLDRFTARVATKEECPANKDWIESTAAEIEADIRSVLRLHGV